MKKIILVLTLILLSNRINAQNVTMAKAFYKKAQIEYEDKNYEETISLLEKTVENLAGETNPDIIFLEAKSRFENDINVNRSKALFKKFLAEADQNDDRINEVSTILVEIETSNNYYSNGNRKLKIYFKQDGEKIIEYNTENGICYMFESYRDGELSTITNMMQKDDVFMIQSKLDLEPSTSGKFRFEYSDGKVTQINYYDKKPTNLIDKKVDLIKGEMGFDTIKFPTDQPTQVYLICDGVLRQWYKYTSYGVDFIMFKNFDSWEDYETLVDYDGGPSFDESIISCNILDSYSNGMVKKVSWYYDYTKIGFTCTFDETGLPIREETTKRGSLKEVKIYNKELNNWKELKKKDW